MEKDKTLELAEKLLKLPDNTRKTIIELTGILNQKEGDSYNIPNQLIDAYNTLCINYKEDWDFYENLEKGVMEKRSFGLKQKVIDNILKDECLKPLKSALAKLKLEGKEDLAVEMLSKERERILEGLYSKPFGYWNVNNFIKSYEEQTQIGKIKWNIKDTMDPQKRLNKKNKKEQEKNIKKAKHKEEKFKIEQNKLAEKLTNIDR